MKIFLDDFRDPIDCVTYMHTRIKQKNPIYLDDWKVVRSYREFVDVVKENAGEITHVSFDHDLGDEHYLLCNAKYTNWDEYYDDDNREMTGYDCAKWLLEYYREKVLALPEIYVHSMNPVGTQNIINLFK